MCGPGLPELTVISVIAFVVLRPAMPRVLDVIS